MYDFWHKLNIFFNFQDAIQGRGRGGGGGGGGGGRGGLLVSRFVDLDLATAKYVNRNQLKIFCVSCQIRMRSQPVEKEEVVEAAVEAAAAEEDCWYVVLVHLLRESLRRNRI